MSKRGKRSINGRSREVLRAALHNQRRTAEARFNASTGAVDDYAGTRSTWGNDLIVPPQGTRKAFKSIATNTAAQERDRVRKDRPVTGHGDQLNTGRRKARSGPVVHTINEVHHVATADETGQPVDRDQRVKVDYSESNLQRRRTAPPPAPLDPSKAYQRNGWNHGA